MKCRIFSWSGNRTEHMPEDIPMTMEEVEGELVPGFICYGIAIGSTRYVRFKLGQKFKEVEDKARKTVDLLQGERQALWMLIRASKRYQLEYWLSLCYPSDTEEVAGQMDRLLQEMVEEAIGQDIPTEGGASEEAVRV